MYLETIEENKSPKIKEQLAGPRPRRKKILKEEICPGSVKYGMRTRTRAAKIRIFSA